MRTHWPLLVLYGGVGICIVLGAIFIPKPDHLTLAIGIAMGGFAGFCVGCYAGFKPRE